MRGEAIIARSIEATRIKDKHGNRWQYHPQSDRHSRVASWAVMFDLLRTCPLLQEHIRAGKVGFGINHEMRDFKQNRKKNLDLVLSKAKSVEDDGLTFSAYGTKAGVVLLPDDAAELARLPELQAGSVTTVLVALEAKACMTEHVKAQPRLYDELASSFQTINGDTGSAIAAAFVMINCADSFVSPKRNLKRVRNGNAKITVHKQPDAARVALAKVLQLPRRSNEQDRGFDAIGVTMVQCRNDGSSVTIDAKMNAAVEGIVTYNELIQRLAHLYATKFSAI